MSRFVRQSKYRHVFGTANRPEATFQNIKLTRSAWDSNFIAVNPKYIAVCWESGGGAAAVINRDAYGKLKPDQPLLCGHTGPVLDLDWNPFHDSILATGSEDCTAKIWQIPEGGLVDRAEDSIVTLKGHQKKVGTVTFNPVASSVLATASPDMTVKLWDIEKGEEKITLHGHTDMVLSVGWNYDGTLLATTCKDKKLRVFDPRTEKEVSVAESHAGIKGSRLVWLGTSGRIVTVGFSRTSDRQMHLWDGKSWDKPLKEENIDTSAGIIMPFWDEDSKILFLAGKGDGNIRYYEMVDEDPYYFGISEFKSSTSQRGMASMPKRACDVSNNEIDLLYKLTPTTIEPISFRVPRKSDQFQEDLFPDCYAGEAALTADQWFAGETAQPKLMSLREGFDPNKHAQAAFTVSESAKATNVKEKELSLPEAKTRIKELETELAAAQARIKELEAKQ